MNLRRSLSKEDDDNFKIPRTVILNDGSRRPRLGS
jgi:hypothetical protein